MTETRFEKARIIGARTLQISMGAPIFVDAQPSEDPMKIAEREMEQGKLPITVS